MPQQNQEFFLLSSFWLSNIRAGYESDVLSIAVK
jgi:hypothetical protein